MAKDRIKSKNQIEPIADWQAADELVKQIGNITLQINEHESKAKATIDIAKAELAENVNPLLEKITILTESLEAFAVNHPDDFGKAQSRKLNFGTIGWRKSTSILIKKTTLGLIHKIFGKNAVIYLRFKEDVDKEALKDLTEQELASVDARRKSTEGFFVEPDIPKAVDYGI